MHRDSLAMDVDARPRFHRVFTMIAMDRVPIDLEGQVGRTVEKPPKPQWTGCWRPKRRLDVVLSAHCRPRVCCIEQPSSLCNVERRGHGLRQTRKPCERRVKLLSRRTERNERRGLDWPRDDVRLGCEV